MIFHFWTRAGIQLSVPSGKSIESREAMRWLSHPDVGGNKPVTGITPVSSMNRECITVAMTECRADSD